MAAWNVFFCYSNAYAKFDGGNCKDQTSNGLYRPVFGTEIYNKYNKLSRCE